MIILSHFEYDCNIFVVLRYLGLPLVKQRNGCNLQALPPHQARAEVPQRSIKWAMTYNEILQFFKGFIDARLMFFSEIIALRKKQPSTTRSTHDAVSESNQYMSTLTCNIAAVGWKGRGVGTITANNSMHRGCPSKSRPSQENGNGFITSTHFSNISKIFSKI